MQVTIYSKLMKLNVAIVSPIRIIRLYDLLWMIIASHDGYFYFPSVSSVERWSEVHSRVEVNLALYSEVLNLRVTISATIVLDPEAADRDGGCWSLWEPLQKMRRIVADGWMDGRGLASLTRPALEGYY